MRVACSRHTTSARCRPSTATTALQHSLAIPSPAHNHHNHHSLRRQLTRPALPQGPSGAAAMPLFSSSWPSAVASTSTGVLPGSSGPRPRSLGSLATKAVTGNVVASVAEASSSSASTQLLDGLPSWASGLAIPLAAVALTAGAVTLAAWLDARFKTKLPLVTMQATSFNQAVMSRCPTVREVYRPTPFLTNGHVETILASMLRPKPAVPYRREFLPAPDGGVVTLDWPHFDEASKDLPEDAPVLILLPGLTGGSGCSYVLHAVRRAARHGIRAVVFNSRGTADSPVLTPQFYSASFTGDMRLVVEYVRKARPNSPLLAAGWSLGANIMMRYLGEQGEDTPLAAAVSMCNPFNLTISNSNWEQGFNKIYDQNLAKALKNIFFKHDKVFRNAKFPMQPHLVPDCRTVREFDDYITVPCFGWPNTDAYYAGSSSSLSVPHIRIPLLCVQALDDPIAPESAIPYAALEANPNCTLVCTPTGGHLGWVAEPGGMFGEPWTDQVMAEWLESVMLELRTRGGREALIKGVSSSSSSSSSGNGKVAAEVRLEVPAGVGRG